MFVASKKSFMDIFYEIENLQIILEQHRKKNFKIGLVPTMGALHEGHLKLIHEAVKENDIVVCSIYVNPIQFTNVTDLEKYPRQLETDRMMLESAGCAILFAPTDQVMYPQSPITQFSFGYLEQIMEGVYRKNHFSGVGIVVSKLFNIIQPDTAYFGQKDLQQVAVIRQLINDLSFPIELKCIPTIRAETGLAMSSRNKRLSAEQLIIASQIYQWLKQGEILLKETKSVSKTIEIITNQINQKRDFKLDYFQIVDAETLKEIQDLSNHSKIALCIAAYLGEVRLIDNLIIFM